MNWSVKWIISFFIAISGSSRNRHLIFIQGVGRVQATEIQFSPTTVIAMTKGDYLCWEKITEWLRLSETSGSYLAQSLCSNGHLAMVAQDYVQMAFGDLQREILHNISGEAVPVLCHLHSTKDLLIFKWRMSQLVPTASCPASEQHWQVPQPIFFAFFPQVYICMMSCSLSLLFSTLKRHRSLSLLS